jgi:nucleoid DNA-binding protein
MSKPISRQEIIAAMALETDLSADQAQQVFKAMMTVFQNSLEQGAAIKIPGFGTFNLRQKNARPGRNPKTGEGVMIPAKKTVLFKPSAYLKTKLVGGLEEK